MVGHGRYAERASLRRPWYVHSSKRSYFASLLEFSVNAGEYFSNFKAIRECSHSCQCNNQRSFERSSAALQIEDFSALKPIELPKKAPYHAAHIYWPGDIDAILSSWY